RPLLEQTGTNAVLDVVPAAILDHDRFNPGAVQQMRQHQPRRACSHDPDLRAHASSSRPLPWTESAAWLPLMGNSARRRASSGCARLRSCAALYGTAPAAGGKGRIPETLAHFRRLAGRALRRAGAPPRGGGPERAAFCDVGMKNVSICAAYRDA